MKKTTTSTKWHFSRFRVWCVCIAWASLPALVWQMACSPSRFNPIFLCSMHILPVRRVLSSIFWNVVTSSSKRHGTRPGKCSRDTFHNWPSVVQCIVIGITSKYNKVPWSIDKESLSRVMNSEQVLIRLWRAFLLSEPIFSYNYAPFSLFTIGSTLREIVVAHPLTQQCL